MARSHANPAPTPYLIWLAPAVSEAGVVLDLVESGVAGAELVADALDRRLHIRPIAILPSPGDEAFVMQAVVERAIGHERADARHQQMDDFVFPEREADIDLVPVGAAGLRLQPELAARQAFLARKVGLGLGKFDRASQPVRSKN